jgi:threonine dehydrogenase-like Zn-dependent dehydrogenase
MPALEFEFSLRKLAWSKLRGLRSPTGYWRSGGPVAIRRVPLPKLVAEDWVILKTAYCGICGSDMKELGLEGAPDNPLRSFLTFPQVMGHEIVGIVQEAGSGVSRLRCGDRVAVSPWLSCRPRGVDPPCPRCREGDFTHCQNFQRGCLPAGMHLGVTGGYGGFAPSLAVHESQCFVIPDGVTFESAVLADPLSVALHSCLLLDPDPEETVLVYGLGIMGLSTVLCLKNLFDLRHVMAVGRHPFQKELALRLGAEHVFGTSGPKVVEDVAAHTGAELYKPYKGSKWTVDGVVGVIDTIGSAATLEAGMRFLTTQGRLVFSGVATPGRCENSVHYFKELEIIGSNAFSIETYRGRTAHAFELILESLAKKKIDPSCLLTHRFPLERYEEAFDTLAQKARSGVVKVVFDFT